MTTDASNDTEPIILCNAGTQRADAQFGALQVHDFTHTTGVQQIIAPECSIFVLGSGVTVTDVWEGQRQRQHTYAADDLIFLPANTEVSAPYVSNAYSETMVRIPCSLLDTVAADLVNLDALDVRYMALADVNNLGLTAAVRNITRSNMQSAVLPLLIESMSIALAAGIICALSNQAATTLARLQPGLSDRRKRMALEYVEANLHAPITLAEMARAAALSPYHFTRSFKAAMGITPVRYIWSRRVERARAMLRDAAIPLVHVALACGFTSQSHFTTVFRQAIGVTPAAYRRALN